MHALPSGAVGGALRLGRRLGLTVSVWTRDRIFVTEAGAIGDLLRRINDMAVDTLPADEAGRLADGSRVALKLMLGGDPAVMDRLEPELLGWTAWPWRGPCPSSSRRPPPRPARSRPCAWSWSASGSPRTR